MAKPLIAIIGRPNVGKSTLLNRLAGERVAIVADLPGTTRDRLYAMTQWGGRELTVVDTGGLEVSPTTDLYRQVKEQVAIAIADADAIIFLVDAREGLVAGDEDIARLLRQYKKPVLLAVNKADNSRQRLDAVDFYRLGLGEPLPISAYHGAGVAELLERLLSELPETAEEAVETPSLKIAIVGRPNVGKSLLLNAIVGEERALVSEMPGTTRDAVDTLYHYEGKTVLLIDTAGIRRRGRIEPGVEHYSLLRALRAIERADVAILVIEGPQGVLAQDLHIAGYIQQACKGIVVAVNKWDLVKVKDEEAYTAEVRGHLKFMPYAPVLFISALLKIGVNEVLAAAEKVYQERTKRLTLAEIKQVIAEALESHQPPARQGRKLRVFTTTQIETNPPTFLFRVNDARLLHFSYKRYLENRLRQAFGFYGTPLRLLFRTRAKKKE